MGGRGRERSRRPRVVWSDNGWVATVWAVLLTTLIALVDAVVGGSVVLIGLLCAGPLVAAGFASPRATAGVGAYALGLAVALGAGDNFATTDHLIRVTNVLVGSGLATWLSGLRTRRESALLQLSEVAEAGQCAILRAIPRQAGSVQLAARYLSASADALIVGDFYDVAATPFGVRAILGDVRGKGLDAVRLAPWSCARSVSLPTHGLRLWTSPATSTRPSRPSWRRRTSSPR